MASPGHTIPPGEVRVTTLAVAEPETRAVSCVAGRDRTLVSGPPENLFPRAALDLSVERLRVRVDGAVREAPLLRPVVGKHYRVGTAVDAGTRLAEHRPRLGPRSKRFADESSFQERRCQLERLPALHLLDCQAERVIGRVQVSLTKLEHTECGEE